MVWLSLLLGWPYIDPLQDTSRVEKGTSLVDKYWRQIGLRYLRMANACQVSKGSWQILIYYKPPITDDLTLPSGRNWQKSRWDMVVEWLMFISMSRSAHGIYFKYPHCWAGCSLFYILVTNTNFDQTNQPSLSRDLWHRKDEQKSWYSASNNQSPRDKYGRCSAYCIYSRGSSIGTCAQTYKSHKTRYNVERPENVPPSSDPPPPGPLFQITPDISPQKPYTSFSSTAADVYSEGDSEIPVRIEVILLTVCSLED
jgi:hypothetical protein